MYYGITLKNIPSLAPHELPGDHEAAEEEDNNYNHENTKKTPSTIEVISSRSWNRWSSSIGIGGRHHPVRAF
jgi:hypothetical protein